MGKGKRQPPSPCPMNSCKAKDKMYWPNDCSDSSDADKKAFKDRVATFTMRDGPPRSTRSQKSSDGDTASSSSKIVRRLQQLVNDTDLRGNSPSCKMTVSDDKDLMDARDR